MKSLGLKKIKIGHLTALANSTTSTLRAFGLILFFASACFGVLSLWIFPFWILDTLVVFRFPFVLHLFSFTCPLEEALHLTLGHLFHISLKEWRRNLLRRRS